MATRETDCVRYQQQRWLRCDAHLWIRPDAAKFLKPGTDPTDVYPALAGAPDVRRKRLQVAAAEQDRDDGIVAHLARERVLLDSLRGELLAIKADLAWRASLRR